MCPPRTGRHQRPEGHSGGHIRYGSFDFQLTLKARFKTADGVFRDARVLLDNVRQDVSAVQ